MGRVDALNDLKRSKAKCCKEFSNELDDFRRLVNDKDGLDSRYQEFLRFILDNAEMDRDQLPGKRDESDEENGGEDESEEENESEENDECGEEIDEEDEENVEEDKSDEEEQGNDSQDIPEHEGHRDHEDQPVKRNKILLIQVKVEGQKAGTSKFVSEKLCNPAQQGVKAKIQTKRNLPEALRVEADLPGPKEPSKGSHRTKAGTSNPVSEKLFEKAKGHTERKLKGVGHLSEKAGASNSVPEKLVREKMSEQAPSSKSHKQMKSPEVIEIEDDEEDLRIPSGQKDKGKRVEILENAAFSTQGISNPFVPSNRYHESLSDENDETLAFRNDVLKVLREPFNLEEYKRLYKEFIGGSYHVHYEDVKKKMHRLRQQKRWIILRGFFFWIQNVSREGAFRPWTDRACLDVEPGHVGDN